MKQYRLGWNRMSLNSAIEAFIHGHFNVVESLLAPRYHQPDVTEEELLLLGISQVRLENISSARLTLTRLLEVNPNCFEALGMMAAVERSFGRLDLALDFAKRAVEVSPHEATAHSTLGDCYVAAGRYEEGIQCFRIAIQIHPGIAQIHQSLAAALQLNNQPEDAIVEYQKAIGAGSEDPANYLALGSQFLRLGQIESAVHALREGLKRDPRSPAMMAELANAYSQQKNIALTEATYQKAIDLSISSRGHYANWLQDEGRFEEAIAQYEKMIDEEPRQGLAYHGLVQARRLVGSDLDLVPRMEEICADSSLEINQRLVLHYALGLSYDQMKEYEKAIRHFDQANQIADGVYNSRTPLDREGVRNSNDEMMRIFSNLGEQGSHAEEPIFIVGMIRSGTTLLEQILARHPSVEPAGEMRFWLERGTAITDKVSLDKQALSQLAQEYLSLAPLPAQGKSRFTDKMPLNFTRLGLIHRAFPNGRIIHIRRNPIDTCLSIWMTHLGAGPQFAYNKENIVFFYREYLRLMDFWRSRLPRTRLFELDYEDLVSRPEEMIRALIRFCGMKWDDSCLRQEASRSSIGTPSRWQARQPIYRSSIERWRKYEPWLGVFSELRNY